MTKSKTFEGASCVGLVMFVVFLYAGSYFVLRWQHVLVRFTNCHWEDESLIADSYIGPGFIYQEARAERLRESLSKPAGVLFRPLCVAEAEIRNRFFPKVNFEH